MAAAAPATGTTVRAQAKWVRLSARKARVVLEHIRGRTVPVARTVLAFTTRSASIEIEKVLRSAVANAEANHGVLDANELVILHAYADEGPTLKRWRARARGRVNRIRKRTCHITIELVQLEGAPSRRSKQAQAPATTRTDTETEAKPKASRRKKTEEAVA